MTKSATSAPPILITKYILKTMEINCYIYADPVVFLIGTLSIQKKDTNTHERMTLTVVRIKLAQSHYHQKFIAAII